MRERGRPPFDGGDPYIRKCVLVVRKYVSVYWSYVSVSERIKYGCTGGNKNKYIPLLLSAVSVQRRSKISIIRVIYEG